MKCFVALSAVLAVCNAGLLPAAAPLALNAAPLALNAAPLALNAAPLAAAPWAAAPWAAAAPIAIAPAPLAVAPSTQYQAQDELGNINYGYANINSAKQEVGNTYGGVTGAWEYIDANGIPQRVEYIADGLGFRVKATNLPVAPAVPIVPEAVLPVAPIDTGVAPLPVEDTEEVAAAKAEHAKAVAEAKAAAGEERKKRDLAATAIAAPLAAAPLAAAPLGLAAPLALAAPAIAVRPARSWGYSSTTLNPIWAPRPQLIATKVIASAPALW